MILAFIVAEAEHGGDFFERYLDLLTDPAHWAFEITVTVIVDIIIIGMMIPFIRRAVRRHDEEHHGE